MNKADEKKAFDDMLAEIEDDSDEEFGSAAGSTAAAMKAGQSNKQNYPDAKKSQTQQSYGAPQYKSGGGAAKMSKEEEEIANFGIQTWGEELQASQEQLGITKRWLCRPCSKSERGSMRCYIDRTKQGFGLQTIYRCYLEGPDENVALAATTKAASTARFMMSAKKQTGKKTSYYLMSTVADPVDDRGLDTVLGKVRGNSVGSRYLITDHGVAPDKTVAPSMLRKEFGVISFEFDSGGPSHIEVWVPYVSPSGVMSNWQPDNDAASMETAVDEKRDMDTLFYLQNKAPKWDEAHGGHVLNFQGRVTESSVKNFQLCCPDSENPDDVVLQFGRVAKNRFTMDFKYPLSPYQAFSICVSCLDGKIADRKGYEYIKKLTGGSAAADEGAGARSDEGGSGSRTSGSGPGQMQVSLTYFTDWNILREYDSRCLYHLYNAHLNCLIVSLLNHVGLNAINKLHLFLFCSVLFYFCSVRFLRTRQRLAA